MLLLALFYCLIIGLLCLIVVLLQQYFMVYSRLQQYKKMQTSEFQRQLKIRDTINIAFKKNQYVSTQLKQQLTIMDENLPTEDTHEKKLGMFIEKLKKLLHSSLHLLETE